MAWARIDDSMPDHPKVVEVGPVAELVAYRAICYANRYLTDGFIPFGALSGLTARLDWVLMDQVPAELIADRMAERLVASGLWHKHRGGFLIHDFLDYNFSRAEIEGQRARNSEAGKKSAHIRATKRSTLRQQGVQRKLNPSPTPKEVTTKIPAESLVENGSRPPHDPARELLEFLNRKAGRHYRATHTTLALIRARLASGVTPDDIRSVIASKVREWANHPDMAKYLRPETLFRASKFESYLGQLPQLPGTAEV